MDTSEEVTVDSGSKARKNEKLEKDEGVEQRVEKLSSGRNEFSARPEVMQDTQVREHAEFVKVESTANTAEKENMHLAS
ncbi:hypothetical protein Tco_0568971 [Tanacetum coccineum]